MEMTIQELSETVGLSAHTLRYYEKEGLIFSVNRTKNGHRRYSEDDIAWIRFLCCLRATGMPISQIKLYITLMQAGESTIEERKTILELHRDALLDKLKILEHNLSTINWKIDFYEQVVNCSPAPPALAVDNESPA